MEHTHKNMHHSQQGGSLWRTAALVTFHCLIGCLIGEILGLSLGVIIGAHPYTTMMLATILAFVSGISLAVYSAVKQQNIGIWTAFKILILGEALSILAMEIVMNIVDYKMGGLGAKSILSSQFWLGLAYGIPAGYLAALPVNYLLLKRHVTRCH